MSSDDTFPMPATAASAPLATEMPCGHIFWGNPPDDCPVCAEIKAAREEGCREGESALAVQGYLTMGNCAHYWEGSGSCPVCVQIKAAEDERGKEVLEMVCRRVPHFSLTNPLIQIKDIQHDICQAYKERYGQG